MNRLTALSAMFLTAAVLNPANGQTAPVGNRFTPVVEVKSTDLELRAIYSKQCECENLPGVNAFYMGDLQVTYCNNGSIPVSPIVEVAYYGLILGKEVALAKEFPTLSPNECHSEVIVENPILVKKSTGIRAKIKPKLTSILDVNKTDNEKEVHKCTDDDGVIPVVD
jgi:hypothetical protein